MHWRQSQGKKYPACELCAEPPVMGFNVDRVHRHSAGYSVYKHEECFLHLLTSSSLYPLISVLSEGLFSDLLRHILAFLE